MLRLRWRGAFDTASLLRHLAARAVVGVEVVDPETGSVSRPLRLPAGPARLRVALLEGSGQARVELTGAALGDLSTAVRLVRRWCDLDADPWAVGDVLGRDPVLGRLVRARPGLRVPTSLDPFEALLRAVVGQRVSVPAARAVLARLGRVAGAPSPGGGAGDA